MACSAACAKSLQKVFEGPCREGMWPFLDAWDVVFLRTAASVWNVAKKYGPYGELFFFLIKNEPVFDREAVDFGSCVPAEALKACALIGLHMIGDEVTSLSLFSGVGRGGGMSVQGILCGKATFVVGQKASAHLSVRCTNMKLKVSLLKSLGRTGQAKWLLSFLRSGSLRGKP